MVEKTPMTIEGFHMLEAELKELRESELWQAGAAVRSLRPENQPTGV